MQCQWPACESRKVPRHAVMFVYFLSQVSWREIWVGENCYVTKSGGWETEQWGRERDMSQWIRPAKCQLGRRSHGTITDVGHWHQGMRMTAHSQSFSPKSMTPWNCQTSDASRGNSSCAELKSAPKTQREDAPETLTSTTVWREIRTMYNVVSRVGILGQK